MRRREFLGVVGGAAAGWPLAARAQRVPVIGYLIPTSPDANPDRLPAFHQGLKENIHVAAVDDQAILLAVFDHRTTVGMVRLFAKEATAAIGTVLAESKGRPVRTGDLAAPLADGEGARMFKERG